jgi:hypothetical protein
VLHFLWLVKADISRPLLSMALLVLLLTARLGRVPAPLPRTSLRRDAPPPTARTPTSRRAA